MTEGKSFRLPKSGFTHLKCSPKGQIDHPHLPSSNTQRLQSGSLLSAAIRSFFPHNKLLVQKSLQLIILQIVLTQGLKRRKRVLKIYSSGQKLQSSSPSGWIRHISVSHCSWHCTKAGLSRIDRATAFDWVARGSSGQRGGLPEFLQMFTPCKALSVQRSSFKVLNGLVVTPIIVLNYV